MKGDYTKFLRVCLVWCCIVFQVTLSKGQQKAIIPGDFPDPTVIRVDDRYYAIGTSSEWGPHFPIYSSDDLTNWNQEGFVFDELPAWAASSFWAPEYFYHDGLYYVYYSAKRKGDGVSCIGVATSRYPDRGFVDKGVVVSFGTESIDAFVVKEGSDLYITWKAYGLDKRPIELLGSKLSADGLRLEGEPFSLLMDTAGVGIEGQSFLKHEGYYYMFYSAGNCCGLRCDYHTQAVRSRSIRGPYERVGAATLLGENANWKCMGHGTFVTDKGGTTYFLFHGYHKEGTTYTGRQGLLAKLTWPASGEPLFTFIPSTDETLTAVSSNFLSGKDEMPLWQWDYRHSKPEFQLTKYGLEIGGTIFPENHTGIVLSVRPTTLRYEIGAMVDLARSDADAQKGLVIYGDYDGAIGVGVKQGKIQFWMVKEGKKEVLNEVDLPEGLSNVMFKMVVSRGFSYHAFYKTDEEWTEIVAANNLPESSLQEIIQWDRSPRPGLHFFGDKGEKAVFKSFYKQDMP